MASTVSGVFSCTIPNIKDIYCPGDVVNWVLTASDASFSDPTRGATLIDCEIRGSPNNEFGDRRPLGKFGFNDQCPPSLPGANLQTFMNNGGKGSFTVPDNINYAGFVQNVNLFFYYDSMKDDPLKNSATCPDFKVARNCSSTSSTTSTSSSTSSGIVATSSSNPTSTATGPVVPKSTGTGTSSVAATSTSVILNSAIAHSASAAFVVALALAL